MRYLKFKAYIMFRNPNIKFKIIIRREILNITFFSGICMNYLSRHLIIIHNIKKRNPKSDIIIQ